MPKSRTIPSWQNAIIVLSGTVVSVVIILGLQWGRPIFIPIALAILLTFLMNPIVKKLQRLGLGRLPAVMLGVAAAGLAMLLIGGLVTQQVTSLVAELPENTSNIKAKIKTLRELASGPMAKQFEKMAEEISSDTDLPFTAATSEQGGTEEADHEEEIEDSAPPVQQAESTLLLRLTGYLGSAFEVLATLAFSLVLLVVFLISRDDLRDRVVVLAGRARVAVTSKALEDVTERISRYLVILALLNGGFGILLSIGLFALQIPYAFLWGFLSGSLRFIPYLGPWIGAVCPIAMALATSESWFPPLAVFGFILVLELISNNILEPLFFGRSTGISSTAVIISAAFWLYLWGPVGLVLSAPIAVCLMVLGRSIPQLSFLHLLIGSEPALKSDMGIYQRFMLDDEHEATRLILLRLKTSPADEVFDEMLIPTLNFAKRDRLLDQLTDEDYTEVLGGVKATLRHADRFLKEQAQTKEAERDDSLGEMHVAKRVEEKPVRLLICPAADVSDFIGTEVLQLSLSSSQWEIERIAAGTLTSELVTRITLNPPEILCIVALPPRGLSHARYICKRLRDAAPELQIVICRWGRKRNTKLEREQLEHAGASFVTNSLIETSRLLRSRLPILRQEASTATQSRFVEPVLDIVPAGNS